jgi:plasmid stabilization system protein ParE
MTTRRLGVHPAAIAEGRAAAAWYRDRSESASLGFLAELDRAIERIQEAPERWPKYKHGTRRFLLRRYPFSVVYRVQAEALEVIAIAHGRRRPGYWKDR